MADLALYWLSFVRDGKFAGACVVEAFDQPGALTRADALGIHPGGEVAFMRMDPEASEPWAISVARAHLNVLIRTCEAHSRPS